MNITPTRSILFRILLSVAILAALFHITISPVYAATQIDLPTPPDSVAFGTKVAVLPNGNLVVTDPQFNGGIGADAGAVYLFNGATGALISTLTGAKPDDAVGAGGVTVLSNGNFVVSSPLWDHGSDADVGAVTWGNATTGVNGEVSFDNSLVGSTASDNVGDVYALTNGNYVVGSPDWDGAATDCGAATFVNGSTGQPTGWVDGSNSLVGSHNSDAVGIGVTALSNGNYVVQSWWWDAPFIANAGAATFVNGTTGMPTGAVDATNSLVGSTDSDVVGDVTTLSNGNYVVGSMNWDNGSQVNAGAATLVNGSTGLPTGPITSFNSLVGSSTDDRIGENITALTNGNYVVGSPHFDGAYVDTGAATFVNGTTGLPKGDILPGNSLVGSTANDYVGQYVTALTNGNYVVNNPYWDGLAVDIGAATFVKGSTGQPKGEVSYANSLVGSSAHDRVGLGGITALTNGNYVVCSPWWNNGSEADAGAATWGEGSSGAIDVVSSANSLVGGAASDYVCFGGATALSNGHYVVGSPYWDNGGATPNAGAVTWVNGNAITSDVVSLANSLVGSIADDEVGKSVAALRNGNYVVFSDQWDNAGITEAGAVTWVNGASGISDEVTPTNSLVGSTANDMVGLGGWLVLNNGDYAFFTPDWDNGGTADSGAVTWGSGTKSLVGTIDATNSVLGATAYGGTEMVYAYDAQNHQLVVGRPADNIVTLFRLNYLFLPLIKRQ